MRRSREDAAETRRRIVEAASRLFRVRGIAAVSVADIMSEVGLTVGGFYRHFESKEALVVEAIDAASSEMEARYVTSGDRAAAESLASALFDGYLSKVHLEHPERGCPVAALCSEVAHESLPTKEAFTKSVQRLLEIVARLAPDDTKGARDRRLHTVASMVGAVVLARATSDETLADDLLCVVRTTLLQDARCAAGKERGDRGPRRSSARANRKLAKPKRSPP